MERATEQGPQLYKCHNCGTNPAAVLCVDCGVYGNHKQHPDLSRSYGSKLPPYVYCESCDEFLHQVVFKGHTNRQPVDKSMNPSYYEVASRLRNRMRKEISHRLIEPAFAEDLFRDYHNGNGFQIGFPSCSYFPGQLEQHAITSSSRSRNTAARSSTSTFLSNGDNIEDGANELDHLHKKYDHNPATTSASQADRNDDDRKEKRRRSNRVFKIDEEDVNNDHGHKEEVEHPVEDDEDQEHQHRTELGPTSKVLSPKAKSPLAGSSLVSNEPPVSSEEDRQRQPVPNEHGTDQEGNDTDDDIAEDAVSDAILSAKLGNESSTLALLTWKLPPLPPRSQATSLAGPFPNSNWVIKDQVLCGDYPAHSPQMLNSLIHDYGIRVFVCLQSEVPAHDNFPYFAQAKKLRQGAGRGRVRQFANYADDAIKALTKCRATSDERIDLLHIPIHDNDIANDEDMANFVALIASHVIKGRKVYIHCQGGHGRTGVAVALLLGILYYPHMNATEALERAGWYHGSRKNDEGFESPQTFEQRLQVKKILANKKLIESLRAGLSTGSLPAKAATPTPSISIPSTPSRATPASSAASSPDNASVSSFRSFDSRVTRYSARSSSTAVNLGFEDPEAPEQRYNRFSPAASLSSLSRPTNNSSMSSRSSEGGYSSPSRVTSAHHGTNTNCVERFISALRKMDGNPRQVFASLQGSALPQTRTGGLSKRDLETALAKMRTSGALVLGDEAEAVALIFDHLDINKNGSVEFWEFLRVISEKNLHPKP